MLINRFKTALEGVIGTVARRPVRFSSPGLSEVEERCSPWKKVGDDDFPRSTSI